VDISYRDVEVEYKGDRFSLFDSYALRLTCTCAGGWELWNTWEGKEELLAGEFDVVPLRVYVAGVLVCGDDDS